jgi:hypothetical protein
MLRGSYGGKGRRATAAAAVAALLGRGAGRRGHCAAPGFQRAPVDGTAYAEAGDSGQTTCARGGSPSRGCGGSQQCSYGKRARHGRERDGHDGANGRAQREARSWKLRWPSSSRSLARPCGSSASRGMRERGRDMRSRARLPPKKSDAADRAAGQHAGARGHGSSHSGARTTTIDKGAAQRTAGNGTAERGCVDVQA